MPFMALVNVREDGNGDVIMAINTDVIDSKIADGLMRMIALKAPDNIKMITVEVLTSVIDGQTLLEQSSK